MFATNNNRKVPSTFNAIIAFGLIVYALKNLDFYDNFLNECNTPLFWFCTYMVFSSFMTIIMYVAKSRICKEHTNSIINKIDRVVMVAFIGYAALIKEYYGNCHDEMRIIWSIGIIFYEYKNFF